MNGVLLLLLVLLLVSCVQADDFSRNRPLSEQQITEIYVKVMLDACRHSQGEWHVAAFDSRAGYWGTGRSDWNNEGIRSVSQMVLVCATLVRYANVLTPDERRDLSQKAEAAIRYAVATHRSGTQKCTDDKQWGGTWQSAMWTGTIGFGAWLIWDQLDAELKQDVERVVASEADRFLDSKPPGNRWLDTKAEENGWTLICISLAACLFPSHPHASAWNEKAIEYMMNTLSVPGDLKDESIIDGRPVREWISEPNLHPDFTLENHNFFHPAYVACSSYFLGQAAMHYTCANRPVPQAADHHLMDIWQMFRTIILPCGETAYPQGADWEVHGITIINLLAYLGTRMKDAQAAQLESMCLRYMRAWQVMCNGDLAVPGSRLGFIRHSICAEQAAYGFFSHKLFPPDAGGKPAAIPAPMKNEVRRFSFIDMLLHRTDSKLATFSWKNRIMGMLAPVGDGSPGKAHFTFPIPNGLVGTIESASVPAKTSVVERTCRKKPDGFETTGVLLLGDNLMKQELHIDSIGEKTLVYQDRITALADVSVTRELGVPIGIENDSITGGRRTVHYQDGETVFDWQKPQPSVTIPGSWANVDGRLGVITAVGSGLYYIQATGYNEQAVYADVLYGSFSDKPRQFRAGDLITRRVVVFYTETTPEETETLSKSVQIHGQELRIKLPEGGEVRVPLL